MAKFQEDMIFKNVSEEDASIILDVFGITSKKVKVWTKELRTMDPSSIRPDLILELDDENLIVEFQSTKVDDDFSKRGLVYVAIGTKNKKNNKEMNLTVLSTAEKSKIVEFKYNKLNTFKYNVTALSDIDGEMILNNVKSKLEKGENPTDKETLLLSIVPLSKKRNEIQQSIEEVCEILSKLKKLTTSQNNLASGIMWLTADKFVSDELERNILCDMLSDRMSLIEEYGERKYNKGIEESIAKCLKYGDTPEELAKKFNKPLEEIIEIRNNI